MGCSCSFRISSSLSICNKHAVQTLDDALEAKSQRDDEDEVAGTDEPRFGDRVSEFRFLAVRVTLVEELHVFCCVASGNFRDLAA